MYNEQSRAHLTDSLLYCSLLYRCYMFQRQRSSSGSPRPVLAKLH